MRLKRKKKKKNDNIKFDHLLENLFESEDEYRSLNFASADYFSTNTNTIVYTNRLEATNPTKPVFNTYKLIP